MAGTNVNREGGKKTASNRIPRAVYQLARRVDNTSLGLLDAGVVIGAWLIALFAGFEGEPSDAGGQLGLYLALPVASQLLMNRLAGLYGPIWRYASIEEATRVVVAVAGGAGLSWIELMIVGQVTDSAAPVFTAPPIAALLILLGCGGIRFQARLFALERQSARGKGHIRTVIVGTDNAGVALARELDADGANSNLRLVGFVDGDPKLSHRSIHGLRVLGATADLERICSDHAVDRILIALPHAARDETKGIVDLALKTKAQVSVLPRASELLDRPLVQGLRDINLADLVGREHAPVDDTGIGGYLGDATVLVSGAGGSIGSEIARQVVRYGPRKVILLDRDDSLLSETAVADLADSELVLASICDRERISDLFDLHRPNVVFHAAAHKHVHILEDHPVEAVQTNVLATWWLAATAAKHSCRRFVQISTDKAVEPCSVMGATKRAAELAVFAVGRSQGLPCAVVRFGNVLGSRGSVVPLFLRQILDGGPVTLTDPNMKRYFMTIPEAVSLVLQAGSMADDGKIFVLDMGKPASINDMARQMIRLAGLRPDEDVEIKITGCRPGERLTEKLHDDNESIGPTSHPSIWSVTPANVCEPEQLYRSLDMLELECEAARDSKSVDLLRQLLETNGVPCDLTFGHSQRTTPAPRGDGSVPRRELLAAREKRTQRMFVEYEAPVKHDARTLALQAVKLSAASTDWIVPPPRGVVLLQYHRVGRRAPLEMDLSSARFEEQMALLAEERRATTIDRALELLRNNAAPARDPVVVTFDDGTADFAERAVPVLVRHGIPVVLYVATAFIEHQWTFSHDGVPLSWAALRDLLSTGLVTVGSHTHTHALLDRADGAVTTELDQSIGLIEDRLGVQPRHFAYPKGIEGSPRAAAAVRQRFASAALADVGVNRYGRTDPHRLARSPIQVSDGMRWFTRKLHGGLALEGTLRRALNHRRYAGLAS